MNVKLSMASLSVAGGLFCALLLGACGSSAASSTATTAATTTSSQSATGTTTALTSFISSDSTYSLSFPSAWTTKSFSDADAPGAAMFVSQDGGDLFITIPLSTQVDASNTAQIATSQLQSTSATDIKLDSSTSTISYPSGSWNGVRGTAVFNGTPSAVAEFLQDHNGKTFMVFGIAPTASADKDGTAYFDPMMNTLKFEN